jgi:hypothetical protein
VEANVARIKLRNLDSPAGPDDGGELTIPINPSELAIEIAVNWTRANVQGMSHQIAEYSHTENPTLPLELIVSREGVDPLLAASDKNILYPARFLMSLSVPGRDPSGEVMKRPPEVLLMWPRIMTVRVVLVNLKFTFRQFTDKMAAWEYVAETEWMRVRDTRVMSEDYITQGFDA